MSALICGSMAFDTIMVFQDQFKNHILPDQVHILNVSFLVPEMRRNFGGCAGNIAFNLGLLGGEPVPMGTIGTDFAPYACWMDEQGIRRDGLREIPESFTAQAFITTDQDDNGPDWLRIGAGGAVVVAFVAAVWFFYGTDRAHGNGQASVQTAIGPTDSAVSNAPVSAPAPAVKS